VLEFLSVARGAVVVLGALFRALGARGWIVQPAGGRLRFWRSAAQGVGLVRVEETSSTLSGWTDDLHVRLSPYDTAVAHGTRIAVSGASLPQALTIRGENAPAVCRPGLQVATGDRGFDGAARVEGPPALTRAVLDGETRRALKSLFEGQLTVPGRSTFWATGWFEAGVLEVEVPEVTPGSLAARRDWLYAERQDDLWGAGQDAVAGLDRLPQALERVIALARRLATPADVPRRVAENLRNELEGGVRLRLLTTLCREFADLPLTRDALLAARDDPDPEVRLQAGIALGPEGRDTLVHLAHGEGAEDATTRRAVAALGEHLTTGQGLSILHGALRTRRPATAAACISVLGARGGSEVIAMLRKVLAVEGPELAAAAATALGIAQAASAEAALVAALDHPDSQVQLAAARALDAIGTVAAVSRLKIAEAEGPPLRAAARQAIASIHSRLPGAAPGQLSLAGGEAGRLSLAADADGRLSLSGKED
jgi:hypothetical protein